MAGDDAFGMSPSFRDGLASLGDALRAGRSGGLSRCGRSEPEWAALRSYQGRAGATASPSWLDGQKRTMAERGDELPEDAWREITVAQGTQGPRSYMFSAPKGASYQQAEARRSPLGNLAPESGRQRAPLLPVQRSRETLHWRLWPDVGGSRWRMETEFETEKSDVGLDEYETRTWAGWHHHVALCLLGGAFLLSLQQAWGEKYAPDHEAAGLPGGAGNAAPGTVRAG